MSYQNEITDGICSTCNNQCWKMEKTHTKRYFQQIPSWQYYSPPCSAMYAWKVMMGKYNKLYKNVWDLLRYTDDNKSPACKEREKQEKEREILMQKVEHPKQTGTNLNVIENEEKEDEEDRKPPARELKREFQSR